MSAEMDALKQAVARQSTVVDGVVDLLGNLAAQLKEAAASDDMAMVQEIIAEVENNTRDLADAVLQNTAQEPHPPGGTPPPVVDPQPSGDGEPQPQ